MMNRHVPPGLNENSCVVMVNPRGPHQLARCFGSVHMSKTRSAGASNRRVAEIERASSVFAAAVAGIFLLLVLNFAKVFVQSVEAFFPESAVVIDPLGDVLERAGVEVAGPPLRVAAAGDQAGALEHFEVLGDRRHA